MVAVEQAMQWFLELILCLCWEIQYYESFNIELEGGTFFNRSQDSHFGQRVAQLRSNKRNWIIVSAPLEKNQTSTRTGVVYRCQYATESCQPLSVVAPEECGAISLGLSLSTQTHSQPSVLACGPTFSHQCGQNTYQNGICFLFNGNFQNVARFPPKTRDCFTAKVDLAFLIDGSGSILPDDFTRMKDFIITMLRRFKLRDVQFAVMQFSDIIMKEFNFEEYERSRRSEVLVSHIQQLSGNTYTPSAIKKLVNEIFIPDSGLRADSKRVMVVITDGKSNDVRTSFNEAIALAEDKDILRFAVGVGPDFQTEDGQQELRIIASNSTNDTVFSIENFKALTTIQEKLQAKIFAIEGTQGMLNMTSFQHEMSQEGFSSILTSDTVVLGTVGAYGWSGGVLLYQGAQETFINISRTDKEIWNSYLGYSVQEASGADVVYYLVGAPRYQHRGEVIVFQNGTNGSWTDVQRIPGEQIGSYFGSEICTLDVTGDGQTDLVLIGAPLYRGQDFGGKVIICTMTPRGNFSCRDSLRGEKGSELGRFGSAIVGLRDLNGDGLSDVAVGAPLEDDHHGSVYIYHGRRTGIHLTYSQRIEGVNYSPALRYFGLSISGVMDVSGDSLTDLVIGSLGTVTVLRSRPVLNVSVTVLFNPWQIPFEAYQCQPAKWSNQLFGNVTVCFRMRRLVPDNWGVLKANITSRLQLDAGRHKWRAVFKTMSRRMTISQMLLTGKKMCQQFPIILPSCVKDYLEPIDLSLNFSLAGEIISGSKGLSPILNKYKETSEQYKLPFQNDCGMDECVDYLRVVFNFSGGDLAVIGRDTVLTLTVVLENSQEDSSHTQLNFLHPSQLSFKKISNVQPPSDQIVCSDLLTDRLMERGNLSCAVNHPVFRKASRVTFNAEFDMSSSEREEEIMNFTIIASSGNSLRITNESSLTRNLSLRYAVNIATSGIEYTRHVNFTAGSKDIRLVKHSYQVENLGSRSLPIHVKVLVPVRIGTHSLWNVTVSERHPGNHSVCQPSVHRLAVIQSESPKLSPDYVRLDCGIALCLEMLCEVAALEKHSSVIFDIQGELMSAALTELNQNKLLLVSKVSLSYDEDKYVDISEDAAHYREAMIITQVDIFKAVNRLGMILGGTFGGLILLIIIIIVFYKFGFFKRNGKGGEGDRVEMTDSNAGEGSSTG